MLFDRQHRLDDLRRTGAAKVFIRLDQRLALGRVDDQALRLGVQLDMRRESGAARADDAGRLDGFGQIHGFTASFSSRIPGSNS